MTQPTSHQVALYLGTRSAHISEKVDVEGIVVITQGIDASCQHSPSHLPACTEAQLLKMQTWKFWGEPGIFSRVTYVVERPHRRLEQKSEDNGQLTACIQLMGVEHFTHEALKVG